MRRRERWYVMTKVLSVDAVVNHEDDDYVVDDFMMMILTLLVMVNVCP